MKKVFIMKRVLLVLALTMSLLVFALAVGCPAAPPADPKTATVELAGNPTTGYEWTYTISPDGVIKVVTDDYIQDDNAKDYDGVGGTYVFTFESVAEGEAEIVFEYARSWETGPPANRAVYQAIVDKDLNLQLVKK